MMFAPMSQLTDMVVAHAAQAQCNRPDSSYYLQHMIALQGQLYPRGMNSRTHLNDYLWDDY